MPRQSYTCSYANVHIHLCVTCNTCAWLQPIVNAVIDGEDIVYRDYVDVSVAVSSPTGLVVPVRIFAVRMHACMRLFGMNSIGIGTSLAS